MKKVFSIIASITLMLTLASCDTTKPEPVVNEVIKEIPVDREVIKEVEIKVEVPVPYEAEYERQYEPGTYFKYTEADESGVITYAVVVVDDYGQVAGVYLDNTTTEGQYLTDDETGDLYVYVHGVKNVIPNTYRFIEPGEKVPVNTDAITTDDLIVGYPEYDAIIATLTKVTVSETKSVVDSNKTGVTWSDEMKLFGEKIVEDQTTYGINLYDAGSEVKTNSISGVTVDIEKEIALVQDILDNDAALESTTTLKPKSEASIGIYSSGTHFGHTAPINSAEGIYYNTAVVVVDEFGNIAGTFIDETYNGTTKKILGSNYETGTEGLDWTEQVNKIETAVTNNQSIYAFEYADLEGNSTDMTYSLNSTATSYKEPVKFTNLAEVLVDANGPIYAVDNALNESTYELKLEEGDYYNTDEFGNIVSLSIRNVITGLKDGAEKATVTVGSKDYPFKVGEILTDNFTDLALKEVRLKGVEWEPQIVAFTLDTVHAQDQAYVLIDEEEFEVYSYEMGSDLFGEIQRQTLLIYKDGTSYKHLQDNDQLEIEKGDTVKFDFEGYNEEETIVPLLSNSTVQSLKDKIGFATEEGQLELYEQYNAYTDYFIGKDTPFILNMITKNSTDSIDGVTIDVDKFNNLLLDTLRLATDSNNASANVRRVGSWSVDESGNVGENLDGLTGFTGEGHFALANGSYYATSDIPNSEGGFYTATMTVVDHKPYTISFDETIILDGKITTKVSSGDKYKVSLIDGEWKNSTRSDAKNYTDAVVAELVQNFDGAVSDLSGDEGLIENYDYELGTTFKEEATFFNGSETDYDVYESAMQKILLEALTSRVEEVYADVNEFINDQIDGESIISSDESASGEIKFGDILETLKIGNGKSVDFDMEAISDFVDVDDEVKEKDLSANPPVDKDEWNWSLMADVSDVPVSTVAEYSYEVDYDDYGTKTHNFTVPVKSNLDAKQEYLDSLVDEDNEDNYNKAYEDRKVVSGALIDDYSQLTYDLLGTDEDVNNTARHFVSNVSDALLVYKKFQMTDATDEEKMYEFTTSIKEIDKTNTVDSKVDSTYTPQVKYDDFDKFVNLINFSITTTEAIAKDTEIKYNGYVIEFTSALPADASIPLTDPEANLIDFDDEDLNKTYPYLSGIKVLYNDVEIPRSDAPKVVMEMATIEKNEPLHYFADAGKQKLSFQVFSKNKGSKGIGSFTVKTFFDWYDQDVEYTKSFQKGEPSIETLVEVYSYEAASDYATSKVEIGNVRDNVTIDQVIDLTDSNDIGIEDYHIEWFGMTTNMQQPNTEKFVKLPQLLEVEAYEVNEDGTLEEPTTEYMYYNGAPTKWDPTSNKFVNAPELKGLYFRSAGTNVTENDKVFVNIDNGPNYGVDSTNPNIENQKLNYGHVNYVIKVDGKVVEENGMLQGYLTWQNPVNFVITDNFMSYSVNAQDYAELLGKTATGDIIFDASGINEGKVTGYQGTHSDNVIGTYSETSYLNNVKLNVSTDNSTSQDITLAARHEFDKSEDEVADGRTKDLNGDVEIPNHSEKVQSFDVQVSKTQSAIIESDIVEFIEDFIDLKLFEDADSNLTTELTPYGSKNDPFENKELFNADGKQLQTETLDNVEFTKVVWYYEDGREIVGDKKSKERPVGELIREITEDLAPGSLQEVKFKVVVTYEIDEDGIDRTSEFVYSTTAYKN